MKKTCLFICLLLLLACDKPDTSWFPLREGYWWQYAVSRSVRGEMHTQKLVMAALPRVTLDGLVLVPVKRADGRLDYYERTETGIYLVDPEDGRKTPVLENPLALGKRWQSFSKILFLEVTGAFEATYNRKIKEEIVIDYEIESMDEEVKVAAGRFRHCMRVNGRGSMYAGGGSLKEFMGIDSINIEIVDWYAPGVGLVKRTRREFTVPKSFENHYAEELQLIKTG